MDRIQLAADEYAEQVTNLAPQGSDAVLAHVYSLPAEERLDAVRATQKALFNVAQDAAGLDLYITVMQGLIERGTSLDGSVGNNDANDRLLNSYNAISYNFAADLADCWPGDTLPRERRHFEAGLKAAEDCVRWRNELNKPPKSFSLAYWAKGVHLLALGHTSGATKSFNHALGFALRDAQDQGKLAPLGPQSTFDVLLCTAYLGIAEQVEGNPDGTRRYSEAMDAFREQLRIAEAAGDSETREEAEIGIGQLEVVAHKYLR